MAHRNTNTPADFWRLVQYCSHGDCPYCCWLWQGNCLKNGYGRFTMNRVNYLAHRLAWELWHARTIPPDLFICHYCNVPACVNPLHLRPGTRYDNVIDKVRANRQQRGERVPSHKLLPEDVRTIRAARRAGASVQELMGQFGISRKSVQNIVYGRVWRHVLDS